MARMKFAFRAMIGLVTMGTLIYGTVVFGGEKQDNIVSNGGFETRQVDKDGPAGWDSTPVAEMREFFSCEWDSATFHSGQRSASISIRDNHPSRKVYYNWNQAPLNCAPGNTYEIAGWVKAKDLKESPFLIVQCWDSGMKKVLGFTNTEDTDKVVGTTDWVQVRATFKVPAETWRIVVLVGIPGHSNPGGQAWFDDIEITRIHSD